jgi:PIN domain nuclease of toxin-antitoxin system
VRALLVDPRTWVAVSAASAWEIELKRNLGRLDAPTDLVEQVTASRFAPLAITLEHAAAAGRLPLHHRDPFDRLLVAQARLEGLTLVTRDDDIRRYDVAVLRA